MTARHLVLMLAAVATLALGVYLAIEVRQASPAIAAREPGKVTPPSVVAAQDAPPAVEDRPRRASPRDKTPEQPPPSETPSLPGAAEGAPLDLKKDEMMAAANKAYDRQDFDEALSVAKRVLANDPANIRMLRIVVSSSCILDDAAGAQKSYLMLPPGDRAQMRTRCERYGVTFTES